MNQPLLNEVLQVLQAVTEQLPPEHREEGFLLREKITNLIDISGVSNVPDKTVEIDVNAELNVNLKDAVTTLVEIRDELNRIDARRLIDSVTHLSNTLMATRTRQEERSIQAAVMAFTGVAQDIDELALHSNQQISDLAIVLQEKIERAYAESGIIRFVPRIGESFDKNRHKALTSVPTDRIEEDITIAKVHRRGYERAGQVLSPALVTIKKLNM